MRTHLLNEISSWIGPCGHAPRDLSPEAQAWFAEMDTHRAHCTASHWPFDQVYPHLARLLAHQNAGDGWSVDLGLMVNRFGKVLPLSAALWKHHRARARRTLGHGLSADQ